MVMTVVTAREHLQWSHMIASNALARATILYLPPDHPIRRLLKVFTFNTNAVNSDAQEVLVRHDTMSNNLVACLC